jgi:mediator of DNA damage checkpoint protein 1
MSQPSKRIFSDIKYHLPSSWPGPRRNDLIKLIEANGGSPANDILDATHVVTNTHQFERWREVPEGVAVVTVRAPTTSKDGNLNSRYS